MYELEKNILNSSRGKTLSWKNGTVVAIITLSLLDKRIIFSNDPCLRGTRPLYTAKGITANPTSSFKHIKRISFTAELSKITSYSVYFFSSFRKDQKRYCSL